MTDIIFANLIEIGTKGKSEGSIQYMEIKEDANAQGVCGMRKLNIKENKKWERGSGDLGRLRGPQAFQVNDLNV